MNVCRWEKIVNSIQSQIDINFRQKEKIIVVLISKYEK